MVQFIRGVLDGSVEVGRSLPFQRMMGGAGGQGAFSSDSEREGQPSRGQWPGPASVHCFSHMWTVPSCETQKVLLWGPPLMGEMPLFAGHFGCHGDGEALLKLAGCSAVRSELSWLLRTLLNARLQRVKLLRLVF